MINDAGFSDDAVSPIRWRLHLEKDNIRTDNGSHMMRSLLAVALTGALAGAACTGSSAGSGNSMMAPTVPTTSAGSAMAGTWVGTASDSTGTMMGAGLSSSMMGNMTWQISQTGNTFTGVMQFPGYGGMGGVMTVSGTINGRTATFTMTMPGGSMMTATCSAVANGTFDLDDLMTQMHGTYSGSNSCTGPFNQGQMSMTRH